MRKIYKVLFVIVVIAIICSLSFYYFRHQRRICFNTSACFSCEIADNERERELGLSYRKELKEDSGMLFVFPQDSSTSFWMKDMKISIDMIFIAKIGDKEKVIDTFEKLPICIKDSECPLYAPSQLYNYVLEVSAGTVEKRGIKIGDEVTIK